MNSFLELWTLVRNQPRPMPQAALLCVFGGSNEAHLQPWNTCRARTSVQCTLPDKATFPASSPAKCGPPLPPSSLLLHRAPTC